jgi:hypothetical protein
VTKVRRSDELSAKMCRMLACALCFVSALALADGAPERPASPEARRAAVARALRTRLGSPEFYRELGRDDLARAAEHRILGRRVLMTGGVALSAAGLLYFAYLLRDSRPNVIGGVGVSRSDNVALVPALIATGALSFACGIFLRKDPLSEGERSELLDDYLTRPDRLATLTPFGFVTANAGGAGLSGRF